MRNFNFGELSLNKKGEHFKTVFTMEFCTMIHMTELNIWRQ